jgi:hypothetical protein
MVMLNEAPVDTRGRILEVLDGGRRIRVHWELRGEQAPHETVEDAAVLRRVHESEEGMAAA